MICKIFKTVIYLERQQNITSNGIITAIIIYLLNDNICKDNIHVAFSWNTIMHKYYNFLFSH